MAVSQRVSRAISRQAVRRGGVRAWGAAEPAAVDRRITVSWLTSVRGEGFAPSTSLVTRKGRCWCRLGFQDLAPPGSARKLLSGPPEEAPDDQEGPNSAIRD